METIVHKENIVENKDFVSKDEAKMLLEYFTKNEDLWQLSCFYESYTLDPMAPFAEQDHPVINKEYFDSLKLKLKDAAESNHVKKLKNLTLSAHKWGTGASAHPHSDNSELDGTPNAWQDNKFVTIIYLNDDYDGGNLFFRDHDIEIAPEVGTMMAFDPGIKNVHGVTEVTRGNRYTMLASWDYEDSVYSEEYLQQKEEEKRQQKFLQDKQKEEWAKGNKNA